MPFEGKISISTGFTRVDVIKKVGALQLCVALLVKMISYAKKYVTVESPMWGCGKTYAHRIFQSLSIRKKWQVRNDELGRSTSYNCCSVQRHHLDCCGKRI